MLQYLLGLIHAIHSSAMSYVTARYAVLVAVTVLLYYLLPRSKRWLALLAASGYFYWTASESKKQLAIFAASVLISYFAGVLLGTVKKDKALRSYKKPVLIVGILGSAAPLIATKLITFATGSALQSTRFFWLIPVGLSFYSMQIISYLADIYRDKVKPQKNILKYALYVSFFPIIIQGPISRYGQLSDQLYEGNSCDRDKIMGGIQLVLWGLFLKYMIADKAKVVVDTVFGSAQGYAGLYVLLAAALYSLQLYTDFLSCVTISRGVSELFGIELADNFNHPYLSTSIKDFWRRWHISLSEWLRDYIYIPLGGSRKGTARKYANLVATFAVSGLWHGGSFKFLFWGLLHAFYQIVGDLLDKPKDRLLAAISLPRGSSVRIFLDTVVTFFLAMIAWIIFRADSLKIGLRMILSIFTKFNPWALFNDTLYRLGLSRKEFRVLMLSLLFLLTISILQERGIRIRDWFNRQNTAVRWALYFGIIWCIWIFGTYGYGFNSADFIYGGF